MKYQVTVRHTVRELKQMRVGDDYIYRQLAHKFIDDLPIEVVKDLFKLHKEEDEYKIFVDYKGKIEY